MSETRSWKMEQVETLAYGTAVAKVSGLTDRYHEALRDNADRHARLGVITKDSAAPALRSRADKIHKVAETVMLLGFRLEPCNRAASVHVIKVDPHTAQEVPLSSVQIGLV